MAGLPKGKAIHLVGDGVPRRRQGACLCRQDFGHFLLLLRMWVLKALHVSQENSKRNLGLQWVDCLFVRPLTTVFAHLPH